MSYPPPSGNPDDPYAPQPASPQPQYYQPYGQYVTPAPAGGIQRERVQHRAGAAVAVEIVEPAQHRLAMCHRGRRIPVT